MSTSLQAKAYRLVEHLAANGAVFSFKPAEGVLPASFDYALPRGGDRWKCRGLIAEAKADPQLWSALVGEIALRSKGAA